MHQSGQLRAHSMQTVQLSSLRAMTPRARGAGASFSWGYCTVAAPLDGAGMSGLMPPGRNIVRVIVLNVTPRPLTRPGVLGAGSLAIYQATFNAMVARMFTSDSGMRTFQASCWSWSSRNRGEVKRTQNTRNDTT